MDSQAIMAFVETHAFVALLAFILGALGGWWLRGDAIDRAAQDRVSEDDERQVGDAATQAPARAQPAFEEALGAPKMLDGLATRERFAVIEQEVSSLRAALGDAGDEDHAALSKDIDAVDEAVKRANGRLKLVLSQLERKRDAQ